jgi:hypothetical protein
MDVLPIQGMTVAPMMQNAKPSNRGECDVAGEGFNLL